MTAFFDISDPSEDLDLDGLLMDIEEFDRHLEHTAEQEVISTFLTSLSAGCSAHQSTAKDETRSPMDSDDIEADAAQCLQLPAELCPRPPELCPEPSGDADGLAT